VTKRVKRILTTAESRLRGTGLLSKQQAFRRSGVSWSTFIRALSINFAGHQLICGKTRPPALRAIHFQTGKCCVVAVDPKDLSDWKQRRRQLYHNGVEKKKKRSQSIHKNGDQARERRTNESAR
jgi:hypothetical protein